MADEKPQSGLPESKQYVAPTQQELFPNEFSELMAVERQRLEVSNRRTEVVRMMVEANDAADKRQYEFQMAQLEARTKDSSNKHSLLKTILYIGGLFLMVIFVLLILMAFFGNTAQQATALKILTILGTGLGGAGIFKLSSEGIKKLTQNAAD